jgi:hypothetical protein
MRQPRWGGGRVPPGQIRKQEVHARNAERKAIKDQEKAYRRYERDERRSYSRQVEPVQRIYRDYEAERSRTYDRYDGDDYRTTTAPTYDRRYDRYRYMGPVAPQYNPEYFGYDQYQNQDQYRYQSPIFTSGYYDDYYDEDYAGEGTSWKQQLLRTLISTVLSGFLNRDGGAYDADYDDGGYDSYYANGPVRYAYNTPYRYGGYAPQSIGYNQSYSGYSNYGQPAYGYDQYDDESSGLLNSIPIGGLLGQGGGGNFLTQILGQVLAQGYLQGALEGRAAREDGYADDGFYDPYVSEEGIYDPFSTSIGENRRLMSEGYELGYQDALEGREQFDPEEVGNVDLVSLLLGNVFRFV